MSNFKCPCCGNEDYFEISLVNTENTTDGADRVLINNSLRVSGDAYVEGSLKGNCVVRVCKDCGFVSLNALKIVETILSDLNRIEREDGVLKIQEETLQVDYDELKAEQVKIEADEKNLRLKTNDENITVKEQRALQVKLEELLNRKQEIPRLLRRKEEELNAVKAKRADLKKKKEAVCYSKAF